MAKFITTADLGPGMEEQAAKEAITRVKEADKQAEMGALAFTLGKFPEYWQEQGDAAIKRLTDRYAALSAGNATPR